MNTFLNGLQLQNNFTTTENGGMTHKSSLSKVLDLFAFGGSTREKSEEDIIKMFSDAYLENKDLALKCLFYLRNIRGIGQGERRLFRICYNWLAKNDKEVALKNMKYIPEFGRYDDLYCLIDTPIESDMFSLLKNTLSIDLLRVNSGRMGSVTLAAKWMPSANASSKETRKLAIRTYKALGISEKTYRKTLTCLRNAIRIVESQLSLKKYDEIEFDKLPALAGLKYRNTFLRHPELASRYREYINKPNEEKKVNASTFTPYDIADKILNGNRYHTISEDDAAALDMFWTNLPDFYQGRKENGICVCDVSGSMWGKPIAAAVGLSAYIAERGNGPFANHFITFSSDPQLVKIEGSNIVSKMENMDQADWGMNTNMEAVLELLYNTADATECPANEMPERIYIFSDMQFDACVRDSRTFETLFEREKKRWAEAGYKLPSVIFWNLNSSHQVIPAIGEGFSYVSGFSPSMVDMILTGKDGYDLMLATLTRPEFEMITVEE